MTSKYIVCFDTVYKYFIEYMLTFIDYTPTTLQHLINKKISHIDELLVIQKGDWLPLSIINICGNIKIINTEQLTADTVLERVVSELRTIVNRSTCPVEVIDYSKTNKTLLERRGFSCSVKEYIPTVTEINYLHNLLEKTEKKYQLGFVGFINPRRKFILDKLKENGYSILIIQTFGEERDYEIATCKALLNIHCEEYFNIFESIRCNRWIFSGMLVISENSIDVPHFANLKMYSYEELSNLNIVI